MTRHGWDRDGWPARRKKVKSADMLIVGRPVRLGDESSVCRVLIERRSGMRGELTERGRSVSFGKLGGSVVTGNEDGIKHAAMTVGCALHHLGLTLRPRSPRGWIGEAGPGRARGDDDGQGGGVGLDDDFTGRNATIMTWHGLHPARMPKGGIRAEGDDRRAWSACCRFDVEIPERRA